MRVYGWRWVWGVVIVCAVMSATARAQTFTTLVNFNVTDGWFSEAALMQGIDGNFYGTTYYGGICEFCGTVFKVTPGGALTTLHNFCSKNDCIDGNNPVGTLLQASDGNIYGVTLFGGSDFKDCSGGQCGTIFKISPAGMLTRFYSFCGLASCADGGFPMAGLLQASNGNFYGTNTADGANRAGTIFEITPAGKMTPLYNFCSQIGCADGSEVGGSLVQAFNGNFYGATLYEGNLSSACNPPYGCGTVFVMTPQGKLTTLFTFDGPDGSNPTGLIQASNGTFYGATLSGGISRNCPSEYAEGCGTLFKITNGGKLTTLYNFCSLANCMDGVRPNGPPIQATDGNFYGTTSQGGANGWGTVFQVTPSGTLTTLYSFCALANCIDGAAPYAGLIQATNGLFYGSTSQIGASGGGTIFGLDMGFGPFVSFIRNPAKIGQQFGILGYGLTGTSSVSFNGISANFKTQSETLLIATVPAGATTGYVTVTTPSGALTSNVPFHVIR
jgi:uncharacterized repeat protein (TIGR03803 family)